MIRLQALVALILPLLVLAVLDRQPVPPPSPEKPTAKQWADIAASAADGDMDAQVELGLRALKDDGDWTKSRQRALAWFFKARAFIRAVSWRAFQC